MARKIYNEEGLSAFFNGVLPGLILVLNPIINFVVYETVLRYFRVHNKGKAPSAAQIFIASSIGKLLATFCTYPILTCRVKLQANKESKDSKARQLIALLKQMSYREYYRGMSAKLLQTILYNAFLMLTYEKMRALIA